MRVLGKDLILFRDLRGRPGLITPPCDFGAGNFYRDARRLADRLSKRSEAARSLTSFASGWRILTGYSGGKTVQTPNTDAHAGIDELASRYVDVDSLEWQQSPFEGVSAKILLQDENGGVRTMLVKMEPGATIPDHEHTGLEQSYILEGSLEDHDGVCGPGQYVWRPAGNRHVATSPDGALMLVMFETPNVYYDGPAKGGTMEDLMAKKAPVEA